MGVLNPPFLTMKIDFYGRKGINKGVRYTLLIDQEDLDLVVGKTIYLSGGRPDNKYVAFNKNGNPQLIHKLIAERMGLIGVVDHKNRNKLDCRRENFRLADISKNSANRHTCTTASGYKGVFTQTSKTGKKTYWSTLGFEGSKIKVCSKMSDPLEAAKLYDAAAIKYFGEFACTNKMMGKY